MRHPRTLLALLVLAALFLSVTPLEADEKAKADPAKPAQPARSPISTKWIDAMQWRSIGPATMGGRVTSIAVNPQDSTNWWAATASGGLLKTVDNGITFEHQFDREAVVSIGDVAVSASNPKILWVGTGECNPRNSVSWGNGAYKSVDAGKTWKHMGLDRTFQTSSVRIHPKNPDIVYVGAMGRCWGTNPERGLFKTSDGGKTWKKILFVDDKTGVIDVQMNPQDPDTLLVATWERQRDGFDTNDPAKKWGPGSGLWKTTDGGKSFKRLVKGLPTGQLGRVGIQYYASNPDVAFLVLESERIGMEPKNAPYMGITGKDADVGARLTQVMKGTPAEKAGLKVDDIVIAIDGQTVHSYNEFLKTVRKHVAGDTLKMEVSRARKSVALEIELGTRPPRKPRAGKKGAPSKKAKKGAKAKKPAPRRPFGVFLGGQRENRQDEQGKEGHEYGGIYKTTDGGESWTRINSVNPRPMYFSEIRVDPNDEKRLWVLGIRLWRSKDGGATFTPDGHPRNVHVDHHALWIDPANGRHLILCNDGGVYVSYDRGTHYDHLNHAAIGQFYDVGVGPRRNYRVYGGLQDNGSWGGPSRVRHGSGPTNEDWFRVAGGDGFRCRVDANDPDQIYFESQNGAVGRRHLKSGERSGLTPRPPRGSPRGARYRFNWYTPFILSKHNSRIYYVAGNRVFGSLDRGNKMRALSPEIAHTERGSATALAESPLDAQVLYVGTDDGAVWMTRDGGNTWSDLYATAAVSEKEPEDAKIPKGPIASGDGDGEADAKEETPKPDSKKVDTAEKPDEAKKPAQDALDERMQRRLEQLLRWDENGDGALQRDELPERMGGFLERADANGDDVVDRSELIALAKQFRRRGRGRGRPGADAARDADDKKAKVKPPVKPASSPLAAVQPDRRWVSWIEPSRYEAGRVYMVFDGHRSDDDRPHVYVSEDDGTNWRSLTANLPASAGTTRVLREDIKNPDLLYLGTEFGAWASIDRGETWTSIATNLPTVAVHAFAQHPTAGELVAATHGRSLWVLDVTTLRQLSKEKVSAPAVLYKPNAAVQWRPQPSRGAGRTFRGTNPPAGAQIYYSLAKKVPSVTLEILSREGQILRTLEAKSEAGLHRVPWNLRGANKPGANGRRRRVAPRVGRGTYRARLTVGETVLTEDVTVELDPDHQDVAWMAHEDEAEEAAAEKQARQAVRRQPNDTGRDS